MSSVLELIAECLPVSDVPEMLIYNYLPGDNCLDDATLNAIFQKPHKKKSRFGVRTYLDSGCTVLHSFDGNPAIDEPLGEGVRRYYRNGKLHRENDKPAIVSCWGKQWYRFGKLHREKYPAVISRHDNDYAWYLNDGCHHMSRWGMADKNEFLIEKYTDHNYEGELDQNPVTFCYEPSDE